MKKRKHIHNRISRKVLIVLGLLALALLAVLLVPPLIPPSEDCLQRSLATMERADYYEVYLDGKPLFRLDDYENWTTANIVVCPIDSNQIDYAHRQHVSATWARRTLSPFCHGRLFVAGADTSQWNSRMTSGTPQLLRQQLPVLQQRITALEKRIDELQYFLRVHNVTDEGFNVIANYKLLTEEQLENIKQVVALISNSANVKRMQTHLVQEYTLLYNDSTGTEQRLPCHILKTDTINGNYLVQTKDRWMPDSVCAVYNVAATRNLRHQQDSLFCLPADTINARILTENGGYLGEITYLNNNPIPNGHGIMHSENGKIYDGMWTNGLRNGFGVSMDSDGTLRVGEWIDDIYQGERLTYTVEHIYGIDISRHQHEKRKKKYNIHWNQLRISSLGTKSKKRISGKVDYPIDFCFVKSTEGVTVRNKYYAADCRQARRYGIHVGSYHFFSLKTKPEEQAHSFIRHSSFPKGDLPPVLDVEPTESQIRNYGGTEKLLNSIRTWLQIVEKKVGVKPILYVNQHFVTKHLAEAPDIKRDYQVWIARYGEYKPDVRLAIWQLSPDGRVTGIHGEVDINIFNGYRDQFEEFLEENCIK
ncbi:MAG: glycosyl hydrolase family 25 [Prevotella sp.]|nr:glycosyl hydrolase family 25 [Prevotella sp.]